MNDWFTEHVREPLAKIVYMKGLRMIYWLLYLATRKEPELMHAFLLLWYCAWPIAFFTLLWWRS